MDRKGRGGGDEAHREDQKRATPSRAAPPLRTGDTQRRWSVIAEMGEAAAQVVETKPKRSITADME